MAKLGSCAPAHFIGYDTSLDERVLTDTSSESIKAWSAEGPETAGKGTCKHIVETSCVHADNSEWRQRIEREAEHFLDVSAWSVSDIAGKISGDQIQVAINLNGYTKGARNEIFALLPAPVQTSYMGFPATTGLHSNSHP